MGKFKGPLSDVEAGAAKIFDIAKGIEPCRDNRIHIEKVKRSFLSAGDTLDDYAAAIKRAKEIGQLYVHDSGAFCKLP